MEKSNDAHHTILCLKIAGGFLDATTFEFGPGLNCIIGGRGTGKTTALEFLRFALGVMPDQRTHPMRARSMETLMKTNLAGGRVVVDVLTRENMRYRTERSFGEQAPQVFNEAGTAVPVELDAGRIFGVDVFSQHEIEEIALSPVAQLELIDRFVSADARSVTRELRDAYEQLSRLGSDLRRLDEAIDEVRSAASEETALEEKLKGLDPLEGPDAAAFSAAQVRKSVRAREGLLTDQLAKAARRAAEDITSFERAFSATVGAQLESDFRTGPNGEIIAAVEADTRHFSEVLRGATATVVEEASQLVLKLGARKEALVQMHAAQEAAYSALVATSNEHGGRLLERAQVEARLTIALAAAKEVSAKRTERSIIAKRRNGILQRVSELRDLRFAARKLVAEELTQKLGGAIRVTVAQSGDMSKYAELLAEVLKGQRLKQGMAADRIVEALLPSELTRAVEANDVAAIINAGFDEARAQKIIDVVRNGGRLYDFDGVEIDDVPRIELLDGDRYKDSPNLSTGQRCTTILPILLAQSERPLLVDQPEDNLDNKFIYETVVKALHNVRGKRQVIFVTHNPNIPVLGNAERIFVLESDGRRAKLKRVGTVEECKHDVETILEGGREAFRQRKVRYGH